MIAGSPLRMGNLKRGRFSGAKPRRNFVRGKGLAPGKKGAYLQMRQKVGVAAQGAGNLGVGFKAQALVPARLCREGAGPHATAELERACHPGGDIALEFHLLAYVGKGKAVSGGPIA